MTARSWIYCRVSSKEQAACSTKLPGQVSDCKRGMKHRIFPPRGEASNCGDPGVFVDPGVSAWKIPLFKRPGFQALWSHARRGDKIVVYDLDRAFRSAYDFLKTYKEFDAAGIDIEFLNGGIDMSNSIGRLKATVIAAFAQFKSDLISERVKEANEAKKARQEGRVPEKPKPREKPPEVEKDEFAAAYGGILKKRKKVDKRPKDAKGFTWLYARVSSSGQTVDSQIPTLKRLDAEYAANGWQSTGHVFIDECTSAYKHNWRDRLAGHYIMKYARRGDVVICARLDRLFRSFADMCLTLEELAKRGVTVRAGDSIDTGGVDGKMITALVGIMAEWESAELGKRIKRASKYIVEYVRPVVALGKLPFWVRARKIRNSNNRVRLELDEIGVMYAVLARDMRNEGMPWKDVADAIEKRVAAVEDRPELPEWEVSIQSVCHAIRKRGGSEDDVKRLKRWAKHHGTNRVIRRTFPLECLRNMIRHLEIGELGEFLKERRISIPKLMRRAEKMETRLCLKRRRVGVKIMREPFMEKRAKRRKELQAVCDIDRSQFGQLLEDL